MAQKICTLIVTTTSILLITLSAYAQQGDAENGETLYSRQCASCHGAEGGGGIGPSLVGCGTCNSEESLFDKIDKDMPVGNPSGCTDSCARDIAAYIFQVFNGEPSTTTTTVPAEPQCPAEVIYGPASEEAELLRRYRDRVLAVGPSGQKLIRIYYTLEGPLVQAMQTNARFKALCKKQCDALIPIIEMQLNR